MNRRHFLGLLGLSGCIDINEDCMNSKKQWWLNNAAGYSEDLIATIREDSFTSPVSAFSSNWTTFGADLPTVSGGNAVFQNGSGTATWSKGVYLSAYDTNLHKWTITLSNVSLTSAKSASSFGIGVGMKSIAYNVNGRRGVGAYIDLSTGANAGKVIMGYLTGTTSQTFSQFAISATALTVSTNDVLTYVLEQNDLDITFTVTNVTTGLSKSVSYTYIINLPTTYLQHNISDPCIWSLGNGITNVGLFNFGSSAYVEQDYALVGYSIGHGYSAITTGARLLEQTFTGSLSTRRYLNLASLSNLSNDYDELDDLAETQINKAVIYFVGTNDLEHANLANYQTQVTAIMNIYRNAGLDVIICKLLPRNDGLDVRPFNNWLVATYGAGGTAGFQLKIVDFFTAFRDSGTSTAFDGNPAYYGDTVHPNPTGFAVLGATLNTAIVEFEAGNLS